MTHIDRLCLTAHEFNGIDGYTSRICTLLEGHAGAHRWTDLLGSQFFFRLGPEPKEAANQLASIQRMGVAISSYSRDPLVQEELR